MNLPRSAFLCVLAVAACSTNPASLSPDETRALVQNDVRTMMAAHYSGDVDTLLAYTPAASLDMAEREQVRLALLRIAEQTRARGRKLESLTFPAPPDLQRTGEVRFAIVPTLMVVSERDQRFESLHYQFGVLAPGESGWKYLDGSRINATTVRSFFPDFPADYKFPQVYRKKL